MKNLTLRIDENVLAAARKQAALKGTTVAKLVREYLENYVAAHLPETAAQKRARRELVELSERSTARLRPDWKWDRERIYEERMSKLSKQRKVQGFSEPPPPPYEGLGMAETAVEPLPTLEEMTTDTGAPPVPGHDEWFRRQVQLALDDEKAGEADYEDFDKVAAEFGFNAR